MADDPPAPDDVAEGRTFTHTRTFTPADVEQFVEVSGDENPHHVEPDDEGRLVVHGLLTGTLPTKIGGDLGYVARELNYAFHRPVRTGEAVTCEMTVTAVEERADGRRVRTEYVCRDEAGETVLTGDSDGVIFDEG
ncbi:dehydratase [Halobacteriales archaeon QH_7_69_31]|nr:MAG: dehydratase [Halobacteriales archaeon QH_7_69_31]